MRVYLAGADGQASRVRQWAGLEAGSLFLSAEALHSRHLGFRRHYGLHPRSNRVEVHGGQLGQVYVTPGDETSLPFRPHS